MSLLVQSIARKHKLKPDFVEKVWRSCKKEVKNLPSGKKNYADAMKNLIESLGIDSDQCLPEKNEEIFLDGFKLEALSSDANISLFKVLECTNARFKKYFSENMVVAVRSSDLIKETTSSVCVGSGPQQPINTQSTEIKHKSKSKKKKLKDLKDISQLSTDEDIDLYVDFLFKSSLCEENKNETEVVIEEKCGFCNESCCVCEKYVKENLKESKEVDFENSLNSKDIELISKSIDYADGDSQSDVDSLPIASDDAITLSSPPKLAKHSSNFTDHELNEPAENDENEEFVNPEDEEPVDLEVEEPEEPADLEVEEPEERDSIEYLNQSGFASLDNRLDEKTLSRAACLTALVNGTVEPSEISEKRPVLKSNAIKEGQNTSREVIFKKRASQLHGILFGNSE